MQSFLQFFMSLPELTQIALLTACCFFLWLIRDKLWFYIPGVLGVLFGKTTWKELKLNAPETKTEAVAQFYDRIFIRSKVVYDLTPTFVLKRPEDIQRELTDMRNFHCKKSEKVVLLMCRVHNVPPRVYVVLKEFVDVVIDNNNISVLLIFPKVPIGNMHELYTYTQEKLKLSGSTSIQLRLDGRGQVDEVMDNINEMRKDCEDAGVQK